MSPSPKNGIVVFACNGGNGGQGSADGIPAGGANGGLPTDNTGFAYDQRAGQFGSVGMQGSGTYFGGQGSGSPGGGAIGRSANTGGVSDTGQYPGGGGNGGGGAGGNGSLGRVEVWY